MAVKKVSLKNISKKMANIDICMMITSDKRGRMTSRPMSNNGDVEYDGNSYFFTWQKSGLVKDIEANPHVNLSFASKKNIYISVEGNAKLNKNRSDMEEHWIKSLDQWFKKGLDTPGVVMIEVEGKSIRYWHDEEMGVAKIR